MGSIFIGLVLLTFLPRSTQVTLELERAVSVGIQHSNHGSGVVNFTLLGSLDIFGYYYTKVKIGSPPRDFNLFIDTGSDITWISCEPCDGCPKLDRYGIPLNSYNPNRSSSASPIPCASKVCNPNGSSCSPSSPLCPYYVQYEDKSQTGGYLVEDVFHLGTTVNGRGTTYSPASALFGCSNSRTGSMASNALVDGLLGLGPGPRSVISQLSSRGVIPKVFSHCLRRDDGGILVLGEILHPGIKYSPIVPSGSNYNLNLQNIAIGGDVHIDPSGKLLLILGLLFQFLQKRHMGNSPIL